MRRISLRKEKNDESDAEDYLDSKPTASKEAKVKSVAHLVEESNTEKVKASKPAKLKTKVETKVKDKKAVASVQKNNPSKETDEGTKAVASVQKPRAKGNLKPAPASVVDASSASSHPEEGKNEESDEEGDLDSKPAASKEAKVKSVVHLGEESNTKKVKASKPAKLKTKVQTKVNDKKAAASVQKKNPLKETKAVASLRKSNPLEDSDEDTNNPVKDTDQDTDTDESDNELKPSAAKKQRQEAFLIRIKTKSQVEKPVENLTRSLLLVMRKYRTVDHGVKEISHATMISKALLPRKERVVLSRKFNPKKQRQRINLAFKLLHQKSRKAICLQSQSA